MSKKWKITTHSKKVNLNREKKSFKVLSYIKDSKAEEEMFMVLFLNTAAIHLLL